MKVGGQSIRRKFDKPVDCLAARPCCLNKMPFKKKFGEISGVSCSSIEDVLVEHDNTENSAMIVPCNEEDISEKDENLQEEQLPGICQFTRALYCLIRKRFHILVTTDTIFVRVYEDRKDLLRAVIIGQEGTPYQDALFFFDVCFPSDYPYSSPLGPNQSTRGKVSWLLDKTTSLLKKMWVPGTSNILQFLVYIQGLVLNAKPFV
ncbi:ubiquitin-conjugating enzyme/RWD-like protein [Tanacetum coccineum]|uniref:Ubiquitin-conjugating enzyme/RWD-like protein n=1 Tax=Tanacetum coccineum TaxID=301880 RepID=A0ABQ5H0H9_9ASTR